LCFFFTTFLQVPAKREVAGLEPLAQTLAHAQEVAAADHTIAKKFGHFAVTADDEAFAEALANADASGVVPGSISVKSAKKKSKKDKRSADDIEGKAEGGGGGGGGGHGSGKKHKKKHSHQSHSHR
jgi:hypothetical protein